MRRDDLVAGANPDVLARRVSEQRDWLAEQGGHEGHGGELETIREEDYRGHHIRVRTTYTLEVDGVPLTGHVGVTNDGAVHYHAIPNYSFSSAVGLVKQLIDSFPDDFPTGTVPTPGPGTHHEEG
jgi:hypothetical protein